MTKLIGKTAYIVLTFTIIMLAGCNDREDSADVPVITTNYVISGGTDTTPNIPIPPYCIFAGDTILINRSDLKERLDHELIAFKYSHTTSTLMLKRAPKFFPIIEPILKAKGIPDDFKYLMVIESNLDPRSVSTAAAAGLWQFTQATGKQYGLEINSNVDERYNTEKATAAACDYINTAYNKYGNWLTAAASYNVGQNYISREITNQHRKNAIDLWLPKETSRYIFRLLAVKMMFEHPENFGFNLTPDELYRPAEVIDTITVRTSIPDLARFANKYGISYRELKSANLWLRESKLKNNSKREYRIAITRD